MEFNIFFRLQENQISSNGAIELFKTLKLFRNIKIINLRGNYLDDTCIPFLIELIEEVQSISYIDLRGYSRKLNNISDKGISLLCPCLVKSNSFSYLRIAFNKQITNQSIPQIQELFENGKIVDVHETGINSVPLTIIKNFYGRASRLDISNQFVFFYVNS